MEVYLNILIQGKTKDISLICLVKYKIQNIFFLLNNPMFREVKILNKYKKKKLRFKSWAHLNFSVYNKVYSRKEIRPPMNHALAIIIQYETTLLVKQCNVLFIVSRTSPMTDYSYQAVRAKWPWNDLIDPEWESYYRLNRTTSSTSYTSHGICQKKQRKRHIFLLLEI